MSNTITQRTGLGQVATIGTLYDARRDGFLQRSLFTSPLPADGIVTGDIPKSSIHVNHVDTYKQKFEELGVSAELGASILAGVVEVGGSGHYLTEERDSDEVLQAAVYHKITTVHEKLNLMSPGLKACLAITSISSSEATHVVSFKFSTSVPF